MKAVGWGFSIFLSMVIIGQRFLGPSLCSDGWPSHSIGRQGACSHHGGVAGPKGEGLLWLASIISGVSIFLLVSKLSRKSPTLRPAEYVASDVKSGSTNAKTRIPSGAPISLRIVYKDENGTTTRRDIRVINYSESNSNGLIMAYCHLRNDIRTFREDRVAECFDLQTGEVISDLSNYLKSIHFNAS